jgi:LysM repeat protein
VSLNSYVSRSFWLDFFAVALVFSVPFTASAGILSFVAEFLSSAKAQEESPKHNSQNIPLLQAARNFDPNPIVGGGDVIIANDSALVPEDGPLGGLPENKKNIQTSDQISLYVVRNGDTLSSIANAFGVSINTIRWSNDIRGSVISPGQTLVILPVSGVRHTVKSGDTIASITKLYKGDIDEVLRYNNLDVDSKLSVGDIVIVPDGEVVSSGQTTVSARTQTVTSAKSVSGYFIRPTSGPKTQGIHGYNGIDIAPPTGTPVVAAAAGNVIISRSSGWNGGYGNYVVIQHNNGTQTLYAHFSSTVVSQGVRVEQGEVIGYVGSSGRSTGPHLHFEIRGAKNPF